MPSQFSRDPFSRLNSILEAENQPRGSIRDACRAVEECLASNRYVRKVTQILARDAAAKRCLMLILSGIISEAFSTSLFQTW